LRGNGTRKGGMRLLGHRSGREFGKSTEAKKGPKKKEGAAAVNIANVGGKGNTPKMKNQGIKIL